MDAVSANVRRIFLPWDRPLLPQAVELLAAGWDSSGPLDVSDRLVIVPTRHSGRRLREALAAFAAAQSQAVFPPHVFTPEGWLMEQAGPDAATRIDSLLAWIRVVMEVTLEDFAEVFPVAPPAQNFSWALRIAREFLRLENVATAGNLSWREIGDRGGPGFFETERWSQLGILEDLYNRELQRTGKLSMRAALDRARENAEGGPNINQIMVLGVPDPAPLAVMLLASQARTKSVTVAILAGDTEKEDFDDWGRPTRRWRQRVLEIPDFSGRVHLRANPAAAAEYIAGIVKLYSDPVRQTGLGILEAELLAPVAEELRGARLESFDPEGKLRQRGPFYHLLACLLALGEEATFSHVRELGRCPDFIAYVRGRVGEEFSTARWWSELDELAERFLVRDLDAARARATELKDGRATSRALALMGELRERLGTGNYVEAVQGALREIFSSRQLEPGSLPDADFRAAVEAWNQTIMECSPEKLPRGVTRSEWWTFALGVYGEGRQVETRPPAAMDLLGWLELLWEDAPHLILGGANDGALPEPVSVDSFLPESVRLRLGLTTNLDRLARDAYILQALVKCRERSGRLDIVYSKVSAGGDPLRPSRLLLQCADSELPERIHRLFAEPPRSAPYLAWRRAWPLEISWLAPPTKVSVTGLGRYLLCPFRFYLRHVLKMEPADVGKTELNAVEFGILCHAVLEVAWNEPGLRNTQDANALREAYWAELDLQVRRRWGSKLDLPLIVQVDSARQRLAAAAALEAEERARGWRTQEIEKKFSLTISGLTVEGRIDRIDQNEKTGAWRVLDYKTFDAVKTPEKAHLESLSARPNAKEWGIYRAPAKARAWVDLQLPLYLRASAELGRVAVGYFNLPKATTQTRISLWEGLEGELRESANRCIDSACAAVAGGEYWPPNERVDPDRDDYITLFQHGVAASIANPPAS